MDTWDDDATRDAADELHNIDVPAIVEAGDGDL